MTDASMIFTQESLMNLADQLTRRAAVMTAADQAQLQRLAYGRTLTDLIAGVRTALDGEAIRGMAALLAANEGGCGCSGDEPPEPSTEQLDASAERLAREALQPFARNPALRVWLEQT